MRKAIKRTKKQITIKFIGRERPIYPGRGRRRKVKLDNRRNYSTIEGARSAARTLANRYQIPIDIFLDADDDTFFLVKGDGRELEYKQGEDVKNSSNRSHQSLQIKRRGLPGEIGARRESVFVLAQDKTPLSCTTSARARLLLSAGDAAVFRRYPFTIILKRPPSDGVIHPF